MKATAKIILAALGMFLSVALAPASITDQAQYDQALAKSTNFENSPTSQSSPVLQHELLFQRSPLTVLWAEPLINPTGMRVRLIYVVERMPSDFEPLK
jgi:hypothetical protein